MISATARNLTVLSFLFHQTSFYYEAANTVLHYCVQPKGKGDMPALEDAPYHGLYRHDAPFDLAFSPDRC